MEDSPLIHSSHYFPQKVLQTEMSNPKKMSLLKFYAITPQFIWRPACALLSSGRFFWASVQCALVSDHPWASSITIFTLLYLLSKACNLNILFDLGGPHKDVFSVKNLADYFEPLWCGSVLKNFRKILTESPNWWRHCSVEQPWLHGFC
jgi:hypothetical protein